MEAGSSIPTGKSSDFLRWLPTSFPFFPAGNARKWPGKNPKNFRPKYCFRVPSSFPAGSDHFPASFRSVPKAGIINLGIFFIFNYKHYQMVLSKNSSILKRTASNIIRMNIFLTSFVTEYSNRFIYYLKQVKDGGA
jgi:hypothetical protein